MIVPTNQFAVVLFQDSTGGHIHAAGHTMMSTTPRGLYSDLRNGYELYLQAKQAQLTGADADAPSPQADDYEANFIGNSSGQFGTAFSELSGYQIPLAYRTSLRRRKQIQ